MKTLKLTVVAIALLAFGFTTNVNAATIEDSPLSQFHAINTYVGAMTRGETNGVDQVIDNTAKFSMLRGKQILSFDKKQMVAFFKENKNFEQGCTVNTTIVNSNADLAVVKVDMKYDGFIRSNYVTLANNGKEWKITDVYTVFK